MSVMYICLLRCQQRYGANKLYYEMPQELIESAISEVLSFQTAADAVKGGKEKGYVQHVIKKLQEKGVTMLPKQGTVRQIKLRMEKTGMLKVGSSNADGAEAASNGAV